MNYTYSDDGEDDEKDKKGKDKKVKSSEENAKSKSAKVHDDDDDNKIFDDLEEEIAIENDDYKRGVIALLNAPPEEVKDKVKELKEILGEFEVDDTYSVIPAFSGKLSKKQILAMAALDITAQIEPDVEVQAFMNTATSWFGVQKAVTDFLVDGNADGNPVAYSKDDIVIAVVDTGIDPNHVDLNNGKIIAWKDVINNVATPYDDNGHGTHVAGIAAGDGEADPAFIGVAPRAALVGVKVLNSAGSGTTSGVVSGVDWVVQNRVEYGIEIMNLSLGSSGCSSGTDSLSLAMNNAFNNGIVPVVAAGNSGPKTCTIGSPGAAQDAVTVGATADVGERGFALASFSSRGPTNDNRIKPDVVAPGVSITAAARGTTNGYTVKSGTSMATPFVAGIAALMLDANPALSPSDVKSKVMGTAVGWGPDGIDIDYGAGRLDGYEAVRNAPSSPLTGTNIAVPTHTFISDSLPGTGSIDNHSINVLDATYPIGIVMIMPSWVSSSSPDFDILLFDPSGVEIASSLGVTRQETIQVSISTTGTYTLQVESYAGSGSYFLDISYGSTPPPPPPTAPSAPQNLITDGGNSPVTLSWSAPTSDGGSSITNYKIYRGTSSGTLATKTLLATVGNVLTYTDTTVADGIIYFYQVTAVNSVGESSGSSEASVTPSTPDTTAPSITGSTGNTASTTGEAKTISATIADNDLVSGATVHYTPMEGVESTIAMTKGTNDLWSANVPVAIDKVGIITYFITASDPTGNGARDPLVGTYAVTVTDNDAPTVAVDSPASNAIVRGTVTISATASDNVGVASVEFFDGLNSIGIDTTSPYSISWPTVNDGAHSITSRAIDAAGNLGSHTISVTVDNTPPTQPVLSVIVVSSTGIDLSWTASTDATTSVAGYKFYRNNVEIANLQAAVTSYSDTGLTPATSYSYQVSASDAIGNESSSNMAAAATLSPPATATEFKVKKGIITRSGGASDTVSGLDFAPKALILFTTGQTANGFADTYRFAMGFSDGTNSRTAGVVSDDAVDFSNAGRIFGLAVLKIPGSGTPTVAAQATVTFGADGFTLNWTGDSNPYIIHYIALGGTSLTNAKAGSFASSTLAGEQTVSSVGFKPDFLMFLHPRWSLGEEGSAPNGFGGFGFAKSSTERAAFSLNTIDNLATTDTYRWQRTNRAIFSVQPNAAGTVLSEADLVRTEANGFTINWIDPPNFGDFIFYLALQGGKYDVGTFTQPTTPSPPFPGASVSQSVANVGFQPAGLMLVSYMAPADPSARPSNRLALGGSDGAGVGKSEGCIWVGDRDNQNVSVTARSTFSDKIISFAVEQATGSASTLQAQADLTSFDPDGFTLNWNPDNVAREIIYIAFG